MKKLVSILMILAMIVPLAGAQSTDIFKKKKKKKSKTEAVDKAKADSIAKSKKDAATLRKSNHRQSQNNGRLF